MAKKKSSKKGGNGGNNSVEKTTAKILSNKKIVAFIAILVAIILAAVLIVYFFFPEVFKKMENAYLNYVQSLYYDSADDDPEGTNGNHAVLAPDGDLAEITTADFSIHFLELGNKYAGDCTLIDYGDIEILIDAGSRKSSATTIKEYVDQYCDGKLDYVISTHAHQDHIAAFVGTGSGTERTGILYQYEVGTLIQFSRHNSTAAIYTSYVSAVDYAKGRGTTVICAGDLFTNGKPVDNSNVFDISGDGKLTLTVLYNYYYDNETADENDYSVCTLLTYKESETQISHYLFTGDLEGEGESKLVDNNTLPEVVLFKGAHHGSKTSSTDKLLSKIKPKYVAVCACAGSTEYTTNNDNTFPTQAFIDRISAYTDAVYCTSICYDYKAGTFGSMNGNIVFYHLTATPDKIKLYCSNNTTKLKDTDWFKQNRTCPSSWQ
ncbi:MAG: ComEC/Rec2 family competence protein [Candidatus Coproplasma sp.]